MTITWRRIAENSGGRITVADLESAANRLEAHQVLYASDKFSRAAYELIVAHLGAFSDVFELLGRSLHHRASQGYVILMSRHRSGPRLGIDETRVGIVLRRIYDDKMVRADIEGGQIVCDVEELQRGWIEWLGREWKFRKGELDDIVKTLRRMGVVKAIAGDAEDTLVIRPAIEDVFGEDVLHQLAADGAGETNESQEDTE